MKRVHLVAVTALLGMGLGLFLFNQAQAQSEPRKSRLSSLIQTRPQLFLPNRLLLGQQNQLTIQAPAGSHVRILFSPEAEGADSPHGQALRVGTHYEEIVGEVPDNGVLSLKLALPEDDSLEGKDIYLEALIWRAEDFSDMVVADLVDASGRKTGDNHLALAKPSKGKGSVILPAMAGMSPQMFQQLSTFSQSQNDDPRKKDLIESGDIDKSLLLDQNSLINRPGSLQPAVR